MKKKSLLAIVLALTLVFDACGGVTNTNETNNHAHETEMITMSTEATESDTEIVTETVEATETATTESIELESEVTEKAESIETETENDSSKKESEKSSEKDNSDTKTDETKNEDSKKNESSNESNDNSGSTNTGSNSNSGSNSGNNSNTGNNNSDSSDTNNGETNTPSEPEYVEPVAPETCQHTGKTYTAGTTTYGTCASYCWDCDALISTFPCNFVNGFCTGCGVNCRHESVSWDSSSSQDGHCNMICNVCGIVYNNVHAISWGGGGHSCSRCGAFWPCDHANCETIRGSWDTGHAWYCNACGAHLYDEGHSFVNGSCSACGWAEPVPETPTDTTSTTNDEALPEDVVTDAVTE